MKKRKEYEETGSKKLIFGIMFFMLTTAVAMASSIVLFDAWMSEIIPGLCLGILATVIYLYFASPWMSERLWWFIGIHLIELGIIVAGFYLPAIYRPLGAVLILIILISEVQIGMISVVYYSILAALYTMDPVESVILYLMYGFFVCACSQFMSKWKGFLFCQTLLFVCYAGVHALLSWFSYTMVFPEVSYEGVIGAAIVTGGSLCCYLVYGLLNHPQEGDILYDNITDDDAGLMKQMKEKREKKRAFSSKKQISYETFADESFPALAEMKEKNPILFKHSKIVAELSRQAAEGIGCDAMLAKAGGWYHKIGQDIGKDYVTDGIEIAKKYKVPKQVIQIIKEHNADLSLPSTKEAAIVMLSDTIISSMEHNRKKEGAGAMDVEKVIEQVFEIRMNSGKLQKSGLTMDDLELLQAIFKKMLVK